MQEYKGEIHLHESGISFSRKSEWNTTSLSSEIFQISSIGHLYPTCDMPSPGPDSLKLHIKHDMKISQLHYIYNITEISSMQNVDQVMIRLTS